VRASLSLRSIRMDQGGASMWLVQEQGLAKVQETDLQAQVGKYFGGALNEA